MRGFMRVLWVAWVDGFFNRFVWLGRQRFRQAAGAPCAERALVFRGAAAEFVVAVEVADEFGVAGAGDGFAAVEAEVVEDVFLFHGVFWLCVSVCAWVSWALGEMFSSGGWVRTERLGERAVKQIWAPGAGQWEQPVFVRVRGRLEIRRPGEWGS